MSLLGRAHLELKFKKFEIIGKKKAKNNSERMNDPVDFIVTWVDGSDTDWLEEKQKYNNDEIKGNGTERYRDWDQFMFWFRAVEKYAPWVRKIHLVTYGHLPKWLDTNHPKLNIVKHCDYIPKKYLPVFNSVPIELNFHHISDLAEHFVYFNDDMYLNKPVDKSDFFVNGLPKYCGIAMPLRNSEYNGSFSHQMFSNLGVINGKFKVNECIERNPELWFSKEYGEYIKYHKMAYDEGYIYGMFFSHVGVPIRKSTMQTVWNELYDDLDKTCRHRFRSALDIQHQIFHMWDIMNGEYIPVNIDYYGKHFGHLSTETDEITGAFAKGECKMICLNDSVDVTEENYSQIKRKIDVILEKKYPEKSSFEL